jgi:hypothetical protein
VKAVLGVVGLALLLAIGAVLLTAAPGASQASPAYKQADFASDLDDLPYTSGPADAGPDDRCAPG